MFSMQLSATHLIHTPLPLLLHACVCPYWCSLLGHEQPSASRRLHCIAQKLKLARYSDVEALVKAAEAPPKSTPAIEVRFGVSPEQAACASRSWLLWAA